MLIWSAYAPSLEIKQLLGGGGLVGYRRELRMVLEFLVLHLGFLSLCGLCAGGDGLRCEVVPLLETPARKAPHYAGRRPLRR